MQVPSGPGQLTPDVKKIKGKRSRTGCRTCRRRKKRCDETRPICSTCQRLHLECEYPEPGTENRNQTRKRSVDETIPAPTSSRSKRSARHSIKAHSETDAESNSTADIGLSPVCRPSPRTPKSPARSISTRPGTTPRGSTGGSRSAGRISKSSVKPESPSPLDHGIQESAFERFMRTRTSPDSVGDGLEMGDDFADDVTITQPTDSARGPTAMPSTTATIPITAPTSTSTASDYASPALAALAGQSNDDSHPLVFPLHISEPSARVPVGPTPPPLGLEMPYLLLNDYQRYGSVAEPPAPLSAGSGSDLGNDFDDLDDADPFDSMDPNYSNLEKPNPSFRGPIMTAVVPPHDLYSPPLKNDPMVIPALASAQFSNASPSSPVFSEQSAYAPSPYAPATLTPVEDASPGVPTPADADRRPVLSESDLFEMSQKQVHPGVAIPVSGAPTTEALRAANPDISEEAVALYEYFRDKQSLVISVSPLNNFRAVFMTISIRSRIVLNALLAWAGWHAGLEEAGRRYFHLASSMLRENDMHTLSKEEILAALILLASAKICSGDVSDWRNYMMWAGEMIQLYGGISCFMESESVLWLLKNFAYKEILTSASSRTPTLFSSLEFEFIFAQPLSPQFPDTLLACCEPLFVVLAATNEMAHEVRKMAKTDREGLENVFKRAHRLEDTIKQARPEPRQLASLEPDERSRQVRLFDVYKLVVLLYIYHSVLRTNSATLRVRYINLRLVEALPSLLGTSVDGILTFPLFIAGICCADAGARLRIMDMFDAFLRRISMRNVQQAQHLVCEVWKRDEMGERYVDWGALLESQGLNIAFV